MNRHAGPVKRTILLILGVCGMLTLFGCGKPKYRLQFDGYGFDSGKTAYAAGEKVTVYYRFIATDTDYRFWLDDEDVELTRDYDDRNGFVFTFTMPDHDVTLHVQSHNSMVFVPTLDVVFRNEVGEADVWILPQTEQNRKTSLWGTPTAEKLGPGETAELRLTEAEDAETWMVRIIDADHVLYSAQDLRLEDGYSLVFRCGEAKFDAVLEVRDREGSLVSAAEVFTGVLGAE